MLKIGINEKKASSKIFCNSSRHVCFISSIESNLHTLTGNLNLRNNKKLTGAKSGECGSWGTRSLSFKPFMVPWPTQNSMPISSSHNWIAELTKMFLLNDYISAKTWRNDNQETAGCFRGYVWRGVANHTALLLLVGAYFKQS